MCPPVPGSERVEQGTDRRPHPGRPSEHISGDWGHRNLPFTKLKLFRPTSTTQYQGSTQCSLLFTRIFRAQRTSSAVYYVRLTGSSVTKILPALSSTSHQAACLSSLNFPLSGVLVLHPLHRPAIRGSRSGLYFRSIGHANDSLFPNLHHPISPCLLFFMVVHARFAHNLAGIFAWQSDRRHRNSSFSYYARVLALFRTPGQCQ